MHNLDIHPSSGDLEWYITDGLCADVASDCDRLERIEAHVAQCDDCAERLANEARIELSLESVAAAPLRRSRPYPAFVGAMLAAAALVLIWLSSASAGDSPDEPPLPAATIPADAGIQVAVDSDVARPDWRYQ